MTDRDPLDELDRALRAATPPPDPARKAEALERAQEIFDRAQGSAGAARPILGRPTKGAAFARGARRMFAALTTRPALTASTALVAVGLIALVPVLRDLPAPGTLSQPETLPKSQPETLTDRAAIEEAEPAPALVEQAAPEAPVADLAEAPPALAAPEPRQMAPAGAMEMQGDAMIEPVPMPMPGLVQPDLVQPRLPDRESFANAEANPVKVTAQEPVSTFSIDVDTASYALVRDMLTHGQLPPPAAVRLEEMVNYFDYAWPAPAEGEAPFRPTVSIQDTPWNPGTRLMTVALQGELPALAERPPLNLVFLVDTSGSMQDPDKLPLLKQSFRLMLGQLRPEDEVAIVTYAGSAGLALPPTAAAERETILAALDRMEAGGATAGQEGLEQAYAVAARMTAEGEVSRVLLATDGDFNVGLSDPEALEQFVARQRDSGTYLSVLGFGRGNLQDGVMQALAQNGNGTAAYIDTLGEAQKVLVDQLSGALYPIADDVKIQVEFNPAKVAEYRLLGYETRALRREDFNNDRVDAGEIGAGHAVTAIYEITPAGSPAVLNDPLRYGEPPAETGAAEGELAFLRLRYKAPGAAESRLLEMPVTAEMRAETDDTRFAAAIAGFAQLLRGSDYTGDWGYEEAIVLASEALGEDRFGYRREAVTLMRLAESLSE
jgi:Ca-activated chloride channel family protein